MAADLSFGSVPPFYREVYDIVSPNQDSVVDQDMFIKLLVKSSLPKQTLCQIWELVDSRQGYLTRTGLYKSLALTAFAQQGKSVSEKLIQNFSGEELPKPSLGDLSDLRMLSIQLRRQKNPTRLGLTYEEICSLDNIQVTVMPQKKGLFLKHVEYEVFSQRHKSKVQRRYNDFVALYELILQRFPYRMIPQLPPKKVMGVDSQFIEERRKALRRFLNILARHPVIAEDKVIFFFLTFCGSDSKHKIKDHFRGISDEYVTSELSSNAKDLVPLDTNKQLAFARDQMNVVHASVKKLRDAAERMALRAKDNSSDMILFSDEMSFLANSPSTESDWGSGGSEVWTHIKKGMRTLHPMISFVSKAFLELAEQEENELIEQLNLFLDLLSAYKDLCVRYENTILESQKNSNKNKRRSLLNEGSSEFDAQEDQQDNRNEFFLHCIHMETQLVHIYMQVLGKVLKLLVKTQNEGYKKIASLWNEMEPIVENVIPSNVNESTPN